MAAPITWRNVAGPAVGDELLALQRASGTLGKSIAGIGENIRSFSESKETRETDAFIAELNNAPDDATRSQMVADASKAFLDMGKVSTAQTAAQEQDFRVAGEERKTTAFEQATEKYGYDVDQRKVTEERAESAEERREDISERAEAEEARTQTTFEQTQLTRTNKQKAKRISNQAIADARKETTPMGKYSRIQAAITESRDTDLDIPPRQMQQLQVELGKAVSRLSPKELGIDETKYANTFRDETGATINMSSAELANLSADIRDDIGLALPNLDKTAIKALAKRITSNIPGYASQTREAAKAAAVQTGSDESAVKAAVKSKQWNDRLEGAESSQGVLTVVKEFMRSSKTGDFSANVIDDQDLNTDIDAVWTGLRTAYGDKLTDANIGKIIMNLVGKSHVDEFAGGGFSDTQVTHENKVYDWDDLGKSGNKSVLKSIVKKFLPKSVK